MTQPQYFSNQNEHIILTATCAVTGEDLTPVLDQTFKHGAVRGFFAEHLTTHRLASHLIASNEKHADNRTRNNNYPVECKSLTDYGVKLCRSGDVGEGRSIDKDAFKISAMARDFIVADTTKYSPGKLSVQWVIVPGEHAAAFGASNSYKKGRTLFEQSPKNITKW